MGKKIGKAFLWLLLVIGILIFAVLVLWHFADRESAEAVAFEGASVEHAYWNDSYEPRAVPGVALIYPGLAPHGNATIHADAGQSDVHMVAAPTGDDLVIRSRRSGGRMNRQCSTITFRSDGKMVAMCGGLSGFRMVLIDPDTLEALATHDLPMRSSAFQSLIYRDLSYTFSDSSGGAYFVLDDQDRVIVGDSDQQIKRLVVEQDGENWRFRVEEQWDMRSHVPNDCLHYNNWFARGECDAITTVVPGPDGLYWWTTRFGRVGTLAPETGMVRAHLLEGEEIQNALAADVNGIYVLTDHAQYAFRARSDGQPNQLWRHPYDRGSERKLGSINQGSGTTPTLVGENYITFTDNADEQINLIVLRRGGLADDEQRQLCSVPLFEAGVSVAENSMIGWDRSIIIENNSGYTNAIEHEDWSAIASGVMRIDIREDESGCDIVWQSDIVVPSVVPKLSQPTGIAYFYSFDLDEGGIPNWYIAGLSFETGELVQKIPTGSGVDWNNIWSALSIGPDGSLYAGTTRGLLQVRER